MCRDRDQTTVVNLLLIKAVGISDVYVRTVWNYDFKGREDLGFQDLFLI